MINIIICDDIEKDRTRIEKIVQQYMEKNKKEYSIHSFSDYDDKFFKAANSLLPFKIYLLDIETPSSSGIDIARQIRIRDIDSVIIFLTAHDELGNTVLKNDLNFLSFINKFDNFDERLSIALRKAIDSFKLKRMIKIQDGNITYTFDINSILYITKDSFERKTIIKTDYGEFKLHKSLSEIVSLLDDRFTQTHRACYINNERKVLINKSSKIIQFDTGESIDLLSDKYKKGVI